jgi:hypothetical protein
MISIIISILIAITPFIYRLFFKRPILTIEVIKDTGSSSQFAISGANKLIDGTIDGNNSTFIYKYEYSFRVIIRNNSDNNAYFINITHQNGAPFFTQFDKLNELEPILAHGQVILKSYYVCYRQSKSYDRPEIEAFPQELENLELTLNYKNIHGVKFITKYNHSIYPTNKFRIKFIS